MSKALREKPCTGHLVAPPNLKEKEKDIKFTSIIGLKRKKSQ